MPKIMIDETLFAHITNDAFLTGSVSQSSASFQNTVGYLNQYLAEQGQIPQEVRCLSQACTQLIVYEEKISNINSVTQAMTIAKSIHEDINALPPNQYLLLPGGWALDGEQHRMVYQVKKDADGNVLFSICNSGEGITHHARRVDQDKERYNPLLTYRIPKENLAQKDFVDVLNKLILAQTTKITDRPKIRTDALYQSLFPKFAYVDGEIITDESLPYASVPLSKTSTQRSLHQLLKAQFPDVDSYRRFIYGFKAKALDDYIEQLLEKGTLNQHHTLLRQAIRHQLRLLTAFSSPSEEPLFDAPTTSREQEKLLSYLQTLTDAPKTTIAIVPTVRSTTTPTPMPRILQPTALYPAINPATALPTEDLADPIIPLDTNVSLFYQLNAMLEHGRSLAEKKQYRTLFNQLGDFFISLPLPTDARAIAPFYEEITSEERALAFYEKMNALQTLYFDSSQEILTRDTTSPRLYVVKLSIAAIANHISEAFPLTPAEPNLSRLLSENTAYMATTNLKWDKRYETLRQLPQKPSSHITPKNPHYYQSIIDKEPTLKAQLEELYTNTYADDVTLLHQNVRANKNTSLYYFTTHYGALSRDPSFSPLIKKFELQNQKERLWVVYNYIARGEYWSERAYEDTDPVPTISLSETETPWSSLSMTSLLTTYRLSTLEPTPNLEKSIYDINEATGAGAALKPRLKYQCIAPLKEDNVIQLTPTPYVNDRDGQTNNRDAWVTHVFTPQVLEDRELFHLRRNPRLQISLTLDYFNRQLEKLSDPNLQKYAEANLFEPGLLLTELEKNPVRFFDQFDAFIKNGLLHFARKGELTQPSLFFIRMAYLVNQYAAAYSPDYNERLKQYRTELCHHIDSQTNPMIITSLHQYRFQCILSMLPNELLENDITEALLSHFRTEAYSNPQHGLDIHSTLHYKEQKQSMVRILKGKRTQLTPELLRRICTIIGFPLPEPITITGQYPKFTVSNGPDRYTINVEQGRIFKGNMAYRNTPIDIQNHPITQQFGLQSCYSCFVSADESVYLLENRTESLRIIKYVAYTGAVPTYRVQKKWPSPTGAPEWYEFIPSSVDQANDWQVNQRATVALPKMLSDRDQLTWKLLTNNTYVLSDGNNIPSHDINAEGIITTRHTRRSLCQDDTWIHQRLQSFEDPNFVNVWQTQEGTHTVRLERYDLEWHIPHGEHTLHWSFEDNDYKLIAGGPTVGENISQVNVQQGDTVLCLLPVQRFISTDKRDGTNNYFELRQDTCARIPKSTQASNACWKHAHTERYLVLKIDPKTELPIPSTPEEALYLCYLYLGSHQPEKAWAVLGECDKRLGGLKGSYEELQYLQWIVKALPYPLPNDKATLSNPPYIACQLKALALLTHHNKKITIPKPSTAANTANGQYERNTLQEVSDFYNTIDSTIYTLFRSLQGMRRELPAEYELSDAERKSLLAHYHQSHDAMGALGYEWVQLHITALRQEEAVFNAKEAARLELTPYERQRQVDITTFLEKHEGVAKRYSQLEHRPIDLVIPTDLSVEETHLSAETKTLLNMENFEKKIIKGPSTDESQTKAVSDLSLSMSDDAFIAHFKDYLTIIQNSQHRLHATVLHFCKATLIATRHVPLKKQTTLIPLLCNVLYRAGHQGGSIPNHIWSIECLIRALRTQPPAITVPQLIDNTQQILTTAKALWDATPTPPAANPPSIISQPKSPGLSEELCTLQQQWHQIEQQFHLEKETLALSAGVSVSDSRDQSDDERVSGEQKYQALQTLQRFANEALQNESILENIRSTCESQIADLKNTQTTLLTDILRLGNAGPDDPVQNKQWHVNIAAGKRQSLSLNRLLTLYFHNDMTRYATETGLSADKIEQLHGQLTLYVANALQQQHRERVQQKLTELTHAHEKEKPQARFLLAQTLFAQNLVDVTTEPALSLFQYYENKWLRPSQKEALNRLLARQESGRFNETIEKMIMGGGKSKIVLPTLAEEKASGDNLVIIEVPRSLLHTNYVDLKATSATLFNQGCYLFEFDRDSDCSPEHLNRLYQQLNDVIVNKQYMVTTGESLQSLELKYLELLHTKPIEGKTYKEIDTRYDTWEQQVLAAERLVLLLRRKGDLIIDEVHQGLLLKTKLNYTLGDPRPIPKSILKHSIDLYQFFREIDIQSLFPEKESPFSLSEALLQRVTLTTPGLIEGIMAILTQQLITNTNSPLYQLIQGLQALDNDEGTNIAELIMHYLQNQSTEIPEVILRAPSPIQEKLAFFKEQISNLLPFTLRRHQGEHYGPSHIPNPLPQKRLLAIPYIANNVPNERSRFGNELESINYTIQSALLTGIEPDLLQTVLEDWLTQARTEVQKNPGMRIDDTVIAGTFRTIMGASSEITLNQLNLDDTAQLGRLYQQLRHDRDFIIEILRTHILPHIKANDNVLHSDSLNHVDLVHSCQGMTGTPWNHTTFHQRLQLSTASSLGTDAYVLKAIHEKKPAIRGIDFKNMDSFITKILAIENATTKVRAIIDINATFKGVSNLSVAIQLAIYLHQHKREFDTPKTLKYVLFFNEHNELSALPITADAMKRSPIIIGSSDPDVINARLNCTPAERFTYYDQAHTLGTDIKQAPDAKGLVLVDNDLSLQHFLQGSMRMRDLLEGQQTIDLIVPEKIQELPLDTLSAVMQKNEQEQLQQDNFYSALAKMRNLLRNDFMERLLHITGDNAVFEKQVFLTTVERYFIETDTSTFFERYGSLHETEDTSTLLNNYKDRLLRDWFQLLQQVQQQPTADAYTQMQQQMEHLVSETTRPGVTSAQQIKRKHTLAMEIQVEQQVEVSVLPKKEMPPQTYDPDYIPTPYQCPKIQSNGQLIDISAPSRLNDVCATTGAEHGPLFSEMIQASANFYQTYQRQTKYIDMYLKPVHALLFRIIDGQLQCVLLTQKECNDLCQQITDEATWWISTTQHTVLAGRPPEDIRQNVEYQSLIEQARYFNGEFNLLLTETAPSSWLEHNTKQKIDFYTQYLWPYHETPDTDIALLYNAFAYRTKAVAFIAKTPWQDCTNEDWDSRFPDSEGEELVDFQNIARAFHHLTQQWDTAQDITHLIGSFAIPFYARGQVERYLTQLSSLRALITSIETTRDTKLLATPAIATQLTALCSALAPVLETPPVEHEKANYELLASLMLHIPMCRREDRILKALAESRYLYQLPAADSRLGSHDKTALECYDDTLIAVAKTRHLPPKHYLTAVQNLQARESSRVRILSAILNKQDMPLATLHSVIKRQTLNEEHIDCILTRPTAVSENFLTQWAKDSSTPFSMLLLVAKKASKKDTVQSLLDRKDIPHDSAQKYDIFTVLINNDLVNDTNILHRMVSDIVRTEITYKKNNVLRTLLEKKYVHLNQETLTIIAQKASLTENDLQRIVAHPNVTLSILQIVAKKTKEPNTVTAILNHKQMETTKTERAPVLNALLDNHAIVDTPLLQRIAESIVPDAKKQELLQKLLQKKERQLNTDTLRLISQNAKLDETELLILAKHAHTNADILNTVAKETKENETAHAVLDRNRIRTDASKTDPLWQIIIDNKALTDPRLQDRIVTEITNRTITSETKLLLTWILRKKKEHLDTRSLTLIATHAHLETKDCVSLAKHSKSNRYVLNTVAQQAKKARVFVALFSNSYLKQPEQTNDITWNIFINNLHLTTPHLIHETLHRSYDKSTFAHITLQNKQTHLNSKTLAMIVTHATLTEQERRIVASHGKTNIKTIIALAEQSTTTETLETILDSANAKIPNRIPDNLFKTIIHNPHATDATFLEHLLLAIIKNPKKPSFLEELLQQKWAHLTTEILDSIIRESSLDELLKDTIGPDILTHIVAKSTPNDETLSFIITHPQTTPDLLALIAAKIQNAGTIATLLTHTSLANDRKAKTLVLQALIANNALSQEQLIQHGVYKAHTDIIDAQLKRLKNAQFFAQDTALDTYIAKIKEQIPLIRSLTDLETVAAQVEAAYKTMCSKRTDFCATLTRLEHGSRKEKYQAQQLQRQWAKLPFEKRTDVRITKIKNLPHDFKPEQLETDTFYLKRLALLPLTFQKKLDWTHIKDECLKNKNNEVTTYFALAEVAYLLNHLTAKTKALSKKKPFKNLQEAYENLTTQCQEDITSPAVRECVTQVKHELDAAKQNPLAQQHRGLKKILVGLTYLAEYLQKTWWFLTRQKQKTDRLFFNHKNIKTKSQELLEKATATLEKLDIASSALLSASNR